MTYSHEVWYLAECQECTPVLPQPFSDETERDRWAVGHHDGTGHFVRIGTRERFRRVR